MGGHKKPMALRELHGTANRNKQRNNPDEPVPERGIGPAPAWMDEAHKAIWDELVGIIYSGVLGEGDRISLEIMADLLYRHRNPIEDKPGLTGAELARLTGLLSEFGMTPASRTKIVIPKNQKRNSFESL